MYYVTDCHNQVIGRYATHRGAMIAIGKRKIELIARYWRAVDSNIACENHYVQIKFINSVMAY